MSHGNKKVDPKKIYSLLDRPPVHECGGKVDAEGVDSYWGESLTLQSEADSANMVKIMDKYTKTGVIDAHIRQNLAYGDQSSIPDFQQAQNVIARASELFDSLDPVIRLRFNNEPAAMIEFIKHEENYDEALKLGLVNERKKPEVQIKESEPVKPKETKAPPKPPQHD